ncbi:MAG: thiol:disulfide interchange protein DsbA/DsbL [Xanthomonadaceae bacterium]|nr:thiol:disulfide interchange protein DsbA/DsbL [Xanthomonadaceae bacterium]
MRLRLLPVIAGLLLTSACSAQAPAVPYRLGVQYVAITPAQPLVNDGKIEVVEVFSYACPHCWHFEPYVEQIRKQLPRGVVLRRVPAVFSPAWEPYARAFYAAQKLGVLGTTHDALFKALHEKHEPLYSLQDLAGFYARHGVQPAQFLRIANSDAVDRQMMHDVRLEQAWGIEGTPTIVVDGKYRSGRIDSYDELVKLTLWLVHKEQAARAQPHP